MFTGILESPVYDTCPELDTVPVGNPDGSTYDADVAQLLVPVKVPTNDPLNEPVLICVELLTNPAGMPVRSPHAVDPIACVGAHEADTAKDAVVANEDEIALLAVPNNDPLWMPINDPVKLPVLI